MSHDPTETARRRMIAEHTPGSRPALEAEHGQVWDTSELQVDYDVLSFLAPFVMVRRKSDGVMGTLRFQASPRFYFAFAENQS